MKTETSLAELTDEQLLDEARKEALAMQQGEPGAFDRLSDIDQEWRKRELRARAVVLADEERKLEESRAATAEAEARRADCRRTAIGLTKDCEKAARRVAELTDQLRASVEEFCLARRELYRQAATAGFVDTRLPDPGAPLYRCISNSLHTALPDRFPGFRGLSRLDEHEATRMDQIRRELKAMKNA